MTALKSLVTQNGTTQQIGNADSLLVGTGIDRSTAGDLTIGGTTATSITLGSNTIPVNIPGDVTTVGGTTFTTDATFEGNVTFGNTNTDTVDFVAKVDSAIDFAAPGYKITNLLNPTAGSQEAATANYVDGAVSAAVNVGSTLVAVGNGTGIAGSAALTWSGTDLDVTGAVNIKGGDPRALTIQDATATTDVLFYDAAVEELTIQSSVSTAVTTIGAGQNNISDTGHTAQLSVVPASSVALDFVVPVASSVVPAIIVKDGAAAPAPLLLDASEIDVNSVKIINVADGTNPNDAVNYSQLSAIVSGVSAVTASAPLASSGGATPDISLTGTVAVGNGGTGQSTLTSGALVVGNGGSAVNTLSPGSDGQVLTVVGGAWAAATPASTSAQGGANAVQYANGTTPADFDGDATLFSFAEGTSTLTVSNGAANSTAITPATVIVSEGSDGVTVVGSASAANVQVALGTNLSTLGSFQLSFQTTTGTTLFNEDGITSPAPFDVYAATRVTATIDGGATYLLTPDSVQTITYAASVAVDFDPSLPQLKTIALTGDIAFTSSNLGASRNVSVRVVGDSVSRNLTSFPAGWKWLGGVAPTVLEANKVAILSLASFSNNDANVVASWSYDGSVAVTDVTASAPLASSGGSTPNISLTGTVGVANGGTGTSTAFTAGSVVFAGASGVYAQDNANLFWDDTANALYLGPRGSVVTSVGYPFNTVAEGASNAALAAWTFGSATPETAAKMAMERARGTAASPSALVAGDVIGEIVFNGYTNARVAAVQILGFAATGWGASGSDAPGRLEFRTAPDGSATPVERFEINAGVEAVFNDPQNNFDFRVASQANANMLLVDASANTVSVGTSANTHTFNVGTGASANFCVASGGRIHTYAGTAPLDGQVLIGDTAQGRFESATLTAGTGISVTNGAGSITIAATGAAASTSVDLPLNTTTNSVGVGEAAYASANSVVNKAIATAASTSRVLGIVSASGVVRVAGIASSASFITGLTLAAGQPVYLSKTAGKLTNDVSAFTTGDVVAEIGIIVAYTSGDVADVLLQPKSITVL